MAEGQSDISGAGFGLPTWDQSQDPDIGTDADDGLGVPGGAAPAGEPGTPTQQTVPTEGAGGQQAAPAEPGPGATPPAGEGAGQQPQTPVLYAGKYRTVEELERGYGEADRFANRVSQEAAEQRRANEALAAQMQRTQSLLEAIAPTVLEQRAAVDPEFAERLRQLQAVQPIVDAQVAPLRQQLEAREQADAEAAQEQQLLAMSVGSFRQRHPDVVAGSPEDFAVARVTDELGLWRANPDSLEIALEASRNPNLLTVLRANPEFVESDQGMTLARQYAQSVAANGGAPVVGQPQAGQGQPGVPVPGAPAPAGQAQGAQPGAGQQARDAAFVETGGHGAPVSGAPGGYDPVAAMVKAYQGERGSPLLR